MVDIRVRRYIRRINCLPTTPTKFGNLIAKKVLRKEQEGEHDSSETAPATETGTDEGD